MGYVLQSDGRKCKALGTSYNNCLWSCKFEIIIIVYFFIINFFTELLFSRSLKAGCTAFAYNCRMQLSLCSLFLKHAFKRLQLSFVLYQTVVASCSVKLRCAIRVVSALHARQL
jgi:hypothetical protein